MPESRLFASFAAHLRHHRRFYLAAVLGAGLFVTATPIARPLRLIAAGDLFFVIYLLLVALVLNRTAEDLRRRAAVEDEGIFVVVLLVLAATCFCLSSVVAILHQSHGAITWPLVLALASAPLAWVTLHVIAAFHYANLYYGVQPACVPEDGDCDPLIFPGDCRQPAPWDFLYFSFVVGMTAQVSDVQITDPKLRRATLGHGVVSFFFNTVLIAMAVNAVVTLAS